jgi:hypothetical protein
MGGSIRGSVVLAALFTLALLPQPPPPHWSLRPVQRPAPPAPAAGAHNPVDDLVRAALRSASLTPAPPADRITLLRRAHADLTGLPPTVAEVDAFLADRSADAFERVVDRLLASPHYGERMAIDWLDVVRYADTVGYHGDQEQNIQPYRDWVIAAFNRNLPFDRFTVEQLAGDLLPDATLEQRIASGFNRLNMTTEEGGAQPGEYLAKYAADRVRATSAVWLGMTLGCAECHDHKYDPFTTRDFYRFAAFFADLDEVGVYDLPGNRGRPPEIDVTQPNGAKPRTMVSRAVAPRAVRVLRRGDWMDEGGPLVAPGIPAVFGALADRAAAPGDRLPRATRLDLARWLVRRDQPLTARVFVNRLWHRFFGRGLSRDLDDLGARSEEPLHSALLDWLAAELMDSGWDVKQTVRLIVLSATYRQSSNATDAQRAHDPHNRWLARQGRPRLPAELIRDQALAASGLLDTTIGGRSARPYQPEGYYAHLNFPPRDYVADRDHNQYRRGVYVHWQRTFLHPMLLAFDAPTREESCAQRQISNTPLAALALLNDPTFAEAARVLAARVLADADAQPAQRARSMFRIVLSRAPDAAELAILLALHERHRAHYEQDADAAHAVLDNGLAPAPAEVEPAELAAWTSVARVLLNLDEAITRY